LFPLVQNNESGTIVWLLRIVSSRSKERKWNEGY
jgi:hypothetical protein